MQHLLSPQNTLGVTMKAPEAPLALLIALLPTAVLFSLAYWRFRVQRRYTVGAVILFGLGVALATLVLAVSATYLSPSLSKAQASNWLAAFPLVVYAATLVVVGRASKLSAPGLVIGGVVALVPLYFFGFYAWLLAACSFGNCL